MSIRNIHHAVLLILLAAGCGETFKPASYVDRLRILAVQADPPEVMDPASDPSGGGPGASSRIRSLVADPAQLEDLEREVSVLYLACTPDPRQPSQGAVCTSYAMLQDPAALAALLGRSAGGDPASCGGASEGEPDTGPETTSLISFLGGERCAHGVDCEPLSITVGDSAFPLPPPTYVVPDHLRLHDLDPGDPARILGVHASVVAIALAASADELLQGIDPGDPCTLATELGPRLAALLEIRDSVVAVKRIQVRGPDATDPPNLNPAVDGILNGDLPLPPELEDPIPEAAALSRGRAYPLRAILPGDPPDLRQPFTIYDARGKKLKEEEEERLYSWFATAGSFEELRLRSPDEPNRWTAPTGREEDDPIPVGGRVFFYTVVRDMRGGVDWAVREGRIP